jgi:hypothetical protein
MGFLKNKFADFNFWLTKTFLKYDRDYTIKIDVSDSSTFSVELLTRYKGTILVFKNLKMGTDSLMSFDLEVAGNVPKSSKLFSYYCDLVLLNLIHNSLENSKRDSNEDRADDTGGLDEERAVHEEDAAVSEKSVLSGKRGQDSI